jgi:hypothetical protein
MSSFFLCNIHASTEYTTSESIWLDAIDEFFANPGQEVDRDVSCDVARPWDSWGGRIALPKKAHTQDNLGPPACPHRGGGRAFAGTPTMDRKEIMP